MRAIVTTLLTTTALVITTGPVLGQDPEPVGCLVYAGCVYTDRDWCRLVLPDDAQDADLDACEAKVPEVWGDRHTWPLPEAAVDEFATIVSEAYEFGWKYQRADGSGDDVPTTGDVSDLRVGDTFVTHDPFRPGAFTTITLDKATSGIATLWPKKGMTTLALHFMFEAGPEGGPCRYEVSAFGPDGTEYDESFGVRAKYERSAADDCTELPPGKSTQGWDVFEVPKKGTVEVVIQGADESGYQAFGTWFVEP